MLTILKFTKKTDKKLVKIIVPIKVLKEKVF